MTRWSRVVVAGLIGMFSLAAWADEALVIGKAPPALTLAGDDGGKVAGGDWQSGSMRDKVHLLMYVDPDKSELNSEFVDAVEAAKFDHARFSAVAVINMAATWLPNIAIESKLKAKQERFPLTTYVKDFKKVLVQKWALGDNNSDVLLFDKSGKLIFRYDGKLDKSQIDTVLQLIRQNY